jgi:cyclopropane-fatty-acyl-phospholipid synthase
MTVRTDPPLHDSLSAAADVALAQRPVHALLQRLLRALRHGTLTIELPGGQRLQGRGRESGPQAVLRLHRWRPLWRLLAQGDLGLAVAWRQGDWSSPDLPALLLLGALNEQAWQATLQGAGPWRALARLWHLAHANTRRGSRHNIAFHYDLGNAFYAQWLDPSMQYSSALYATGRETLEEAQAAKLDAVLRLLDVPAGARVLEIGCGWGTLATTLAQRSGARVTGLTLSTEQLAHAQALAERTGVADRVDLRLQDYRDVGGRYDRIVSIEMFEAVGERYWPVFFRMMAERLKPGGRAGLQVITIQDRMFPAYRRTPDFIQRHVFPGGMLPPPKRLAELGRRVGLPVAFERVFGLDYARTLAEWRQRFRTAWPAIEPLGFDERFKRLWEFYLHYCEAGFRAGTIDVRQIVFAAPR